MHTIVYAIVKNMIKSKTLTQLIQIVHSRFLSALIVSPGLHPSFNYQEKFSTSPSNCLKVNIYDIIFFDGVMFRLIRPP